MDLRRISAVESHERIRLPSAPVSGWRSGRGDDDEDAAMSNLGLFGLSLLVLTISGTLMAVIKSAWDEPWVWWEYAVLAAIAVGVGIAVANDALVTG